MKTICCSLILCCCAFIAAAQEFNEAWASIEFKERGDYKKYEDDILQCANYILSVPAIETDRFRLVALQALIKWMTGTPDYQFAIDNPVASMMKDNDAVLSIYMASVTKYILEHKDKATDAAGVKLNSYTIMLEYCENKVFRVALNKELKRAIEAKNNGKLKKYLGL